MLKMEEFATAESK